jgi:thiol-disulfide isomerase/thioredoxin
MNKYTYSNSKKSEVMKKLFTLIIATLLALFTLGCSESSTPQLNKHYSELPTTLNHLIDSPVVEVFSLTCGHCKSMEEYIPNLEQESGYSIKKVHVTFNQSAQVAAMIYYSAYTQLKGEMDHQINSELFSAFHLSGEVTQQQQIEEINKVFTSRGLTTPYELDEEQQKDLFEIMELASKVTQEGQIGSVPGFIVSGKYLINTSAHDSTTHMAQTIKFLANK